jgi:hypothetical protein
MASLPQRWLRVLRMLLLVLSCLALGAALGTARAQGSPITVSVDRGNGATYAAGDTITVCVSLNLGGPNIFQANSFPVRLTDRVAGTAPVVLLDTQLAPTGQRCLTTVVGPPFGSETITGQVFDPVNGGVIDSASVSFISVGQRGPTAPSVQLNALAASVQLGQPASFTYTVTPVLPGGRLTSLTLAYGDGTTRTLPVSAAGTVSGTTTYTYTAAGTYTATLRATDASGGTGSDQTSVVVVTTTPPPPPGGGPTVTYSPGWNLIGVPAATTIPAPGSPYYTWQAGSVAYGTSPTPQQGLGYWVFFSNPTAASLPFTGPQTVSTVLPAGQFVMVGNPGSAAAVLSGMDVAYQYDPLGGYQPTTQIPPGEGAWVLSVRGGVLTITSGIR